MDDERFTIQGATGVDLELPIAGPGSRSYAFVIDWHIRVLVALAWLIASMLIVNGGLTWRPSAGRPGTASIFIILLPSIVIYFLYHPILEVFMRGQTPGKRSAGVRIVNREGGIPGTGAILIRNVFRLLDSLPACYLLGLATTFGSAQRVRIGDMAAGTLLIIDDGMARKRFTGIGAATDRGSIDLSTKELAEEILERWPALEVDKRDAIARSLLKRVDHTAADRIDVMGDEELKSSILSLTQNSPPR